MSLAKNNEELLEAAKRLSELDLPDLDELLPWTQENEARGGNR